MSFPVARVPLLWIAAAAALGILAASLFPAPPLLFLLLFAASFAGCLASGSRHPRLSDGWLLLAALAAFALYTQARLGSVPPDHLLRLAPPLPASVTVRGVVDSDPELRPPEEGVPGSRPLALFIFRATDLLTDHGWEPAEGRISMMLSGDPAAPFHYGERLEVNGLLDRPQGPRNPGEFDFKAWLARRGIFHSMRGRADLAAQLPGDGGNPLEHLALAVRHRMLFTLQQGLENDPQASGLMSAMLFGYQDGVAEDLAEDFRNTGTLHLFAVSGQNIGVVLGLLVVLLQICGVIHWRWAWTLFPAIFVFCLATGMQPSAARACVMAGIVLVGWAICRPVEPFNLLGAAAMTLWLRDPGQIFDTGFQLSFLVVAGLCLAVPPLQRFLVHAGRPDPWIPRRLVHPLRLEADRLYRPACMLAVVSAAAWISSLPLILGHFSLFAPITLLANLLVVPLASLVVVLSCASVAAGAAWLGFSALINKLSGMVLGLIVVLVHWMAGLPGGHFYLRIPPVPGGAARPVFHILAAEDSAPAVLEYRNRFWLIDTGPEAAWRRTLDPFRRRLGVNRWDGVILTQATLPHLGGSLPMLGSVPGGLWAESGIRSKSPAFHKLLEKMEADGIGKQFWKAGDVFGLGDGLRAEVLWPGRENPAARAEDCGLVLRFVHPCGTLLWAGDISDETEALILASGRAVMADVLVQGEHSSRRNLSAAWLDAVRPRHLIHPPQGYELDKSLDFRFWDFVRARGIEVWLMERTGAVTVDLGAARPGAFLADGAPVPRAP
jgi:ComEC/Rec2-related protein